MNLAKLVNYFYLLQSERYLRGKLPIFPIPININLYDLSVKLYKFNQ